MWVERVWRRGGRKGRGRGRGKGRGKGRGRSKGRDRGREEEGRSIEIMKERESVESIHSVVYASLKRIAAHTTGRIIYMYMAMHSLCTE